MIAMRNKFYPILCFLLAALALAACEPKEIEVSLDPISFADWAAKQEDYKGKVVVADLWATWCQPCIERFPKMVTLNEKYANQGVAFVSINFDDPADGDTLQKAEIFLKDVNAQFDNFYFKESLIDAFEHMQVIGLPTVLIFNQAGEETHRLTGTNPNKQFTEKDIESAIEKLLAGG